MTISRTHVFQNSHWEDADLILMARVKGLNGQNITQASLSSITAKVFDLSSGDQVGATMTLTIGSVVFDSLQTDDLWTVDATGYNFKFTVDGAYFPTGGRDYRIETVFTPESGKSFPFVTEVSVKNLLGS